MTVPEQIQEGLLGDVTATIERSDSFTSFFPPMMSCPCESTGSSPLLEQPAITSRTSERTTERIPPRLQVSHPHRRVILAMQPTRMIGSGRWRGIDHDSVTGVRLL